MAVRARQARPRAQHFLRSSKLAAELVRAAAIDRGDLVLDLGAGTGVLTRALAATGADVVAVELDGRLAASLRERFANVVVGDAARIPFPTAPFRVVANLPFLQTTPILRRLLDPRVPLITADVIVQWGFAEKRAAVWPSTQLSVQWSAWHELAVVRRLARSAFAPPPAVDAAVLRATRRSRPLVPPEEAPDFHRFLERGFRGGLRAVASARELRRAGTEHGFDPQARPRDLDAHQWAALYAVRRRR